MEALVHRFEANPRQPEKDFHLVYAGQLSVLNGVTLLLEALKHISNPKLKVTILGGGEFASQVEEAAQHDSRIQFLGLRPHDEVLKIYEQADLLVNLRRTDYQTHRYVFPSKVVECLATGRPLLSTCTGHVESEFQDLVFPLRHEEPEALARAIEELTEMPREQREAVGVRARNYVLENKTWEGHARRFQDYLEQVVFHQKEAA